MGISTLKGTVTLCFIDPVRILRCKDGGGLAFFDENSLEKIHIYAVNSLKDESFYYIGSYRMAMQSVILSLI